jgi:hypothetical protein
MLVLDDKSFHLRINYNLNFPIPLKVVFFSEQSTGVKF